MTNVSDWWRRPRIVTVVVDNPSWFVPFAEKLVDELREGGDEAIFVQEHTKIPPGAVAFYLSCVHKASAQTLSRSRRNLVVHESDLPRGREFSPLTWQILEGKNRIPVCLLEALEDIDAGPVIYRDWIEYEGHELISEMRATLGQKTIGMCRRFLGEEVAPAGRPQLGEATYYQRRRPADSQIDPERTIAEQFNLLRVVDNVRYPAWFRYAGHRYKVAIEKMD